MGCISRLAHPYEWKKGVRFYKRLKAKIAARAELSSPHEKRRQL